MISLGHALYENKAATLPAVPDLNDNLRVPAYRLLNVLGELVLAEGEGAAQVKIDVRQKPVRGHLRRLLAYLRLAEFSENCRELIPLDRASVLRHAWRKGDVETVAILLSPYRAFAEQAGIREKEVSRPKATESAARRLAELLGFGLRWERGRWIPGGGNPLMREIREAVLGQFDKETIPGWRGSYTVADLMLGVMLGQLGVSPVRARRAWDRMTEAGVFRDIGFRAGGSSTGECIQDAAELGPWGWRVRRYDWETIRGCRDLVDRRGRDGG